MFFHVRLRAPISTGEADPAARRAAVPTVVPRTATNLDDELVRHGCPAGAAEFRRVVAGWWESLHARRSPEEFRGAPADVAEFCEAMRALFACPGQPDELFVVALTEGESRLG